MAFSSSPVAPAPTTFAEGPTIGELPFIIHYCCMLFKISPMGIYLYIVPVITVGIMCYNSFANPLKYRIDCSIVLYT